METYFIRHGRDWDIGPEAKVELREKNRIAIHYEPTRSISPEDYSPVNRKYIARFARLAESGGLVVSTHPPHPGCWIGKLPPKSNVCFVESQGVKGHPVVLKTLDLTENKYFIAPIAARLLVLQLQQQTFSRWPAVRDRARTLYEEGQIRIKTLADFVPFEQEVLCGEFLRSNLPEKFGLPKLAHFTFPVGRTLQDVDIAGLTAEGERVFAQVTYRPRNDLGAKVHALRAYRGHSNHLVMFCNGTEAVRFEDVSYMPIHQAMSAALQSSATLAKAMGYPVGY